MGTVRIKKRTSYRACSCCRNTVVSKGGGGEGIGGQSDGRTSRAPDSVECAG